MKKFLLASICTVAAFCLSAEPIPVSAGIPPVGHLLRQIGGDRVSVSVILPDGRSPHDFSPTPGDVRALARSRAFFYTGMPFEKNLLRTLASSKVGTFDVSKGIARQPMEVACTHDHEHGHAHSHATDELDPHIWLDTNNLKQMASQIASALRGIDPAGKDVYTANEKALCEKLDELHAFLTAELAPFKGRAFYVHHGAFGYFARETGLRQIAVELGGREPSPKHLADISKQARADKVKVIFVQPQFNPGASRALAESTGAKVVPLDPLAADAPANLRDMGRVLKDALR